MAVNSVTYFTSSTTLFILAYLVLLVDYAVCALCVSLSLTCGGVYLAAKLIPRGRVDPKCRAVFITGCDTGFGHELACRLDKLGFTIFAGCLVPNGADARQLRAKSSSNLKIVQCDVTSNTSIKSAKDFVSNHLVEKLGRIVNVGSMSGLWTIPANSPYCMTKYAVESYTDALRYEMHKWSVKVVLVEPGQYGSSTAITQYLNGYTDQLWKAMDETTRVDYGRAYVDAWNEYFKESMTLCFPESSPVIDAMVDAITSCRPKHRYLVGNWIATYLEAYWNSMLPSWLTDRQFYKTASTVATPAALVKTKSS